MSDADDARARRIVFDKIFRSFVENGIIEVGNRSPSEIIEDFKEAVLEAAEEDPGWPALVVDHRDLLLENAKRAAESGSLEIAITFYALWIEHTVNGNLINGLRRKGYDAEVVDLLLRKLDLETKFTVLWRVAGFRRLSSDNLRLIKHISEARNAFVHYKWRSYDNATTTASESMEVRLRTIVERAESLVTVFNEAISAAYWNNRDDEVIGSFYRDFIDRDHETKSADPPSSSC